LAIRKGINVAIAFVEMETSWKSFTNFKMAYTQKRKEILLFLIGLMGAN
jgi:hypothetical protein